VLPRNCAGCRSPGSVLCDVCGNPAEQPLVRVAESGPVVAAHPYQGGIRAALIAYKERNRRDLARALAAQLIGPIETAASLGDGADVVLVPVPASARAARQRGGDHVLRLARLAGRSLCLPVCPALRQARAVTDSAGLGAVDRARNLAGSMHAVSPPSGAVAVVVDDIVTSGATLREASASLRAAGWPVAGSAVIAATPLRRARL
jgi:predicted amidophosphoribosyltransferase